MRETVQRFRTNVNEVWIEPKWSFIGKYEVGSFIGNFIVWSNILGGQKWGNTFVV